MGDRRNLVKSSLNQRKHDQCRWNNDRQNEKHFLLKFNMPLIIFWKNNENFSIWKSFLSLIFFSIDSIEKQSKKCFHVHILLLHLIIESETKKNTIAYGLYPQLWDEQFRWSLCVVDHDWSVRSKKCQPLHNHPTISISHDEKCLSYSLHSTSSETEHCLQLRFFLKINYQPISIQFHQSTHQITSWGNLLFMKDLFHFDFI